MAKNQVTLTFAGDSKQLSRHFSKMREESAKLDRSLAGSSTRIGNSFASISKKAAVAATAVTALGGAAAWNLGKGLLDATHEASDLQESMSKAETVFGDWIDSFNDMADTAAQAMGMSRQEVYDAAGSFGNLFDQLGFGKYQMSTMSQDLIALSSDFASFHNADITDVLEAQQAAFRGEYDSLQRFLPLINAAAVEQKAMAITGAANKDALTAQDKALATYQLMLEGAGEAMGDFARTSDGLANQERQTEAEIANMRAEIGEKMLPVVQKLTKLKLRLAKAIANRLGPAIDKVGAWFSEHRETFESLGNTIMTVVVPAVGEIITTAGTALYNALAWVAEHKDTWLAIGNAIAGVAVPAFTTIAGWIETIAANKDALLSIGIGVAAVLVPSFVAWAISAGAAAIATLAALAPLLLIGAAVAALAYVVITNWDWIKEKTGAVWDWLSTKVTDIWDGISDKVTSVWGTVTSTVDDAIDSVTSTFKSFRSTVTGIWDAIGTAIKSPIQAAVKAIKKVWNSTVGGRGISIPSIPGIFGGASFTIPTLAEGGVVTGPTLAWIGEGGSDEAVVPLDRYGGGIGAGSEPAVIEIRSGGTGFDDALVELLRMAIADRGGSVQAVLG